MKIATVIGNVNQQRTVKFQVDQLKPQQVTSKTMNFISKFKQMSGVVERNSVDGCKQNFGNFALTNKGFVVTN